MKAPKIKHPHFDRKPPKCANLRYILHVGFKELPVLNVHIIKYLYVCHRTTTTLFLLFCKSIFDAKMSTVFNIFYLIKCM